MIKWICNNVELIFLAAISMPLAYIFGTALSGLLAR